MDAMKNKMIKRRFVNIDKIDAYDEMHRLLPNGSFSVDEEKDGQTTQQHRDGIEYIKDVLRKGAKVRPLLVQDNFDGTFLRLDGFKRYIAYKELGYKIVEAFVCDPGAVARRELVQYDGHTMELAKGGQYKESYGLFEGREMEDFDYDKIEFLYKSEDPSGLRIEMAENIHIHWGEFGRYRWDMGRKDFIQLAKAISAIQ